jgi:predicted Holliday junction resolvase-like endonuclease
MYRFTTILIKISMAILHRNANAILKFIQKHERTLNAKAILSQRSNAQDITVNDFKLHHMVKKKKTKKKHGISRYSHLILGKATKNLILEIR